MNGAVEIFEMLRQHGANDEVNVRFLILSHTYVCSLN